MIILLVFVAAVLASCSLGTEGRDGDVPCENGRHSYTQYFGYGAKDSIVSIEHVNNVGDTTHKEYYEYDSLGFRVKEIWLDPTLDGGFATTCFYFVEDSGKNQIRKYRCESNKLFVVTHFGELGLISRIGYYSSTDTAEWYASIYSYDSSNHLVRIEFEGIGLKYTQAKLTNDASGQWLVFEEYSSSGSLLKKEVYQKVEPTKEMVQTFNESGKLISWEFAYLNKRGRKEKAIGCDAL